MFEHSLIDLEAKKQPRRRWISLPIAIALHVVGVTAFAFASYWNVGSVPEPQTNVVFLSLAPTPEIPMGGGGGGRPKPPETKIERPEPEPVKPSQPVQPTEDTVPEEVPVPTTTSTTVFDDLAADSDTGGDTGGDPNLPPGPGFGREGSGEGSGGGDGGGDGSEMGTGDTEPIHITVGVTKPVPIHKVSPRYTEAARRAGIQGAVIVEAIIDEQGNVDNVRVLRSLPFGLDREAVSAVQQWKFTPAMMANKPVKVYFMLTVNFGIQR